MENIIFAFSMLLIVLIFGLGFEKTCYIFGLKSFASFFFNNFSLRPRTLLYKPNSNKKVVRGIRRDLRQKKNTLYQYVSCHTNPEKLRLLKNDILSAVKHIKIQFLTANEIFADSQKGILTHTLLEILKEDTTGNFEWYVCNPPVSPHMRITDQMVAIEHPHNFDQTKPRYFDYSRNIPSEIIKKRNLFSQLIQQSLQVKSEKDIKMLNEQERKNVIEQFNKKYEEHKNKLKL